jgi:serine/threonine-protein kinase
VRWRRVRALFDAALDVAPAMREDWLRETARDEPSLADEVRALLDADAAPHPLLDDGVQARLFDAAGTVGARVETATPAVRVGPWRVGAVVGHGGMGTVFRATDDDGRVVALKRLDAPLDDVAAAARFAREVRLGARVTHPHLLPVLDALHAEARAWLTMPLVEGETLRALLDREGRLPVAEAVRVGIALADALAAIHAAGVVHRDLKPENVLLAHAVVAGLPLTRDGVPSTTRPQPLLTDFGIARALDAVGDDRITRSGLLVGTPTYMSPEQLRGQRGVDGAADVWALGVVLHEMLAGGPPRRGPSLRALFRGQPSDPPALRSLRAEVPDALDALVARMLAPERGRRLADAVEVWNALRAQEARAPEA